MRKSLNSLIFLFRRKHFPLLFFLVIFLSLPLFVFVLSQTQDIRQRAASNSNVTFVDEANQEVTQTTTPDVRVRLNSPWPVKTLAALNSDVLGQASGIFQPKASFDDVNEVDGKLDSLSSSNSKTLWVGNGGTQNTSYTGIRYPNVTIPKNARIVSAQLQLRPTQESWIGLSMNIAGDASGNSGAFSETSLPSLRALTVQRVSHNSNSQWKTGRWYILSDVTPIVQEIVKRNDWESGNSLSLIMKGTGGNFGRKFVYSFDGNKSYAPRLSVVYETTREVTPILTPTRVPTNTPLPPTPTPTHTPTPTLTPTPTPQIAYIESITLAEDSAFTQNTKMISSVSENPLVTPYTFSNSNTGVKNLYVKFKSTTGEERVVAASIPLVANTPTPTTTHSHGDGTNSMAMMGWRVGGKNSPNPAYDKCDDGTDVVAAHNHYYVVAYDGLKYPTWHPPVVTNPITGNGKCYFGHEHGTDPQKYMYWDEIVEHFGKDITGDGSITKMVISSDGKITEGDRAGLPFGIANEHMDMYYNQEGRDSLFVRHEDHVGHKIELVNNESEMVNNTTHPMNQLPGTVGINVPYGSDNYQPTGVSCTHLHKFHQGTHSGDAIRNNLHEVIFHSSCMSVDVNGINAPAVYPNNKVLLTGMMAFGNPGEYVRFCFADRTSKVCTDGKNANGSCAVNDPLLSKLPNAINSTSLGRNMVDKYCLQNWSQLNPGNNYFGPYEIWEGDFAIYKTNTLSDSTRIAEHGRQWDVLDPIRFVDIGYQHPTRPWQKDYQFNSENCKKPGGAYDALTFVGGCSSRSENVAWDSPQSGFRGLKRTTYFGRNKVSNRGGAEIWYTDPLGGNAVTTPFATGLKQKISSVEADICKLTVCSQLNDRAIQRLFDDGNRTVHAPN